MQMVIEVRGLRKMYGSMVAVDDVSFDVAAGEIFGLLGPNGAGKTTTVECLQGLRHADGGQMRVLGLDPWTQRASLRRRIGSQLQESALPDRLKVWEALDLFATAPLSRVKREQLLEQWGLADKRNTSFANLSGGQRQRLFVALALVNQPEIVFLDEMTTGLDPAARRATWDLIEAIGKRGTTVVLVSHFMDEVERLCQRVAVVNHGRIVAMDTPARLVEQRSQQTRVLFTWDGEVLPRLEAVPHVYSVRQQGSQIEVEGDGPVLQHVASALLQQGIEPADLRVERPTLEEVFLQIVGKPEEEQ
ncbi:MAG TPA: ABC transporter ATP-binding protein [Ktedonobacteraceae bacterium]|jgi:ABC-2 type transport system ATP-binding protein|nr:ABC transporter ATP-binding protein [Ktedonobacteraceae bacterium]